MLWPDFAGLRKGLGFWEEIHRIGVQTAGGRTADFAADFAESLTMVRLEV